MIKSLALSLFLLLAAGTGGIGHGAIGGGAIGLGGIGPIYESGLAPPGSPSIWVAGWKEEAAGAADNSDVTAAVNYGSIGGTFTNAGTGAVKLIHNRIGGQASFVFTGANQLEATFTADSYPVLAFAVARMDGATGVNSALFNVGSGAPDFRVYKNGANARLLTQAQAPLVASIYDGTGKAHVHGCYAALSDSGTITVFADGSSASATGTSAGPTLGEFYIGAEDGTFNMTGDIGEVVVYFGTAASDLITSAGGVAAAAAEIEAYLESVYGTFPITGAGAPEETEQ